MPKPNSFLPFVAILGTLTGCGQQGGVEQPEASSNDDGSVHFRLEAAPGIELDEVSYSITVGDHTPIEGAIAITEENLAEGLLVENVPVGSEVLVALRASTEDGIVCQGDATVEILPAATAALAIVLQCRLPDGSTPSTGTIDVDATFNVCPKLQSASAEPGEAAGTFALTAAGEDSDGDSLEFSWSAESGTFSDSAAADATYTCSAAGETKLTVSVLDAQDCADSQEVTVTCPEVEQPPDSCEEDDAPDVE